LNCSINSAMAPLFLLMVLWGKGINADDSSGKTNQIAAGAAREVERLRRFRVSRGESESFPYLLPFSLVCVITVKSDKL
jgi:hypothetical protein